MNLDICLKILEQDVMYESFKEGTVIINSTTGIYYNFNNVGASIWKLIEKNFTVSQIIEVILYKYNISPAQAKDNTINFIFELKKEKLIEETFSIDSANTVLDEIKAFKSKKRNFNSPVLKKYTDLQELTFLYMIEESLRKEQVLN